MKMIIGVVLAFICFCLSVICMIFTVRNKNNYPRRRVIISTIAFFLMAVVSLGIGVLKVTGW